MTDCGLQIPYRLVGSNAGSRTTDHRPLTTHSWLLVEHHQENVRWRVRALGNRERAFVRRRTLRGDVAKHIDDANLGFGQPGVHLFLQLANVRFKRLEDLI